MPFGNALSDSLGKLDSMLSDPRTSVEDFTRIIEIEPVIAGRVMKWANGALYGSGRAEVTTLKMAVGRLGLYLVRDLVYSVTLPRLFTKSAVLNHRQFWKHSLAVAIYARLLCRKNQTSEQESDLAYMAGLMHDVGVLVFAAIIPTQYSKFIETCQTTGKLLEEREEAEFGISHQELGAIFMTRWWSIPFNVAAAVKQHHANFDELESPPRGALVVKVSNSVVNSQHIHNGTSCYSESFSEMDWLRMGLTLEDTESIIKEVEIALEEAEELLTG